MTGKTYQYATNKHSTELLLPKQKEQGKFKKEKHDIFFIL